MKKHTISFSDFLLLLEQEPQQTNQTNTENTNTENTQTISTQNTEGNNNQLPQDISPNQPTQNTSDTTQGGNLNIFNDENINEVSTTLQQIDTEENVSDEKIDSEHISTNNLSDEEKVRTLFTDTGDPKIDYSVNSEANQRLAKFKFSYAGINLDNLLTKKEKEIGVRVNEILDRLTPDQYYTYIQKSKELRKEFPKIAEREKRIIIYNSNIQFFINDEKGFPKKITNKNDLANAIKKLEKYMDKKFGDDWVDDQDAIEFLKNIKVNFSEESKITPNLLPISFLYQEVLDEFSLFNKIYIDFPQSVKTFIEKNIDNDLFIKSPIFKSFINDYEENTNSSKMSIYAIIKLTSSAESEKETAGESESEEENIEKTEVGEELGGAELGGEEVSL